MSPKIFVSACAASLLLAVPAAAQMPHVPSNDWRQEDRHDALVNASSPPNFFVELRFGGYLPSIDSAFNGKTPFQDVFGLDCTNPAMPSKGSVGPRFMFGLELDYTPRALRIPYVGAIGPGIGWSFTSFSATALATNTNMCSAEGTTLQIMPMHASIVLRADELMRRTGIPIVPYGKVGVGLSWWRASNDLGTEHLCNQGGSVVMCTGMESAYATGTGLTPSLHFAVGGMVALNFLEPRASARLDEQMGMHHAYVFGEYYNDQRTLATNVLRVGASTWSVGLAADF